MTKIFDKTFERTLDRIVSEHSSKPPLGRLELWVFENESYRRKAERSLAEHGVDARVRSAYKPLLHAFLEDVEKTGLQRVRVSYPVHPACPPDRFRMEIYPLTELLDGVEFRLEAGASDGFFYDAALAYADGREETLRIFAPNREYVDFFGETILTPTGWIKYQTADGKGVDGRLETEYEEMYASAITAVSDHPWGSSEPFFETLSIHAELPTDDVPLGFWEETESLREALHEDLYFSLLEVFQKKTGRPVSDRTIHPGQVAPAIVRGTIPSIRIETRPLSNTDLVLDFQDLDTAKGPISAAQVSAELARIEGEVFTAKSFSGRTIPALYHPGSDAGVMISGGQHANETTGVVGALRAARALAGRPGAHFSVSPLENPDGYDLHRRLCADNPKHMHHAARYTALGNDLEYQEGDCLYEKTIRVEAQRRTGALFHINLHGYASHEWTRPLSGYIPRGFPTWMLPHGFFLVLHYHEAWADRAERLLDALTLRLADLSWLREFTESQLRVYSRYVEEPPFRIINGFPCDLSLNETTTVPLRLITEYPDETIWGDAFTAGHSAQMEAVLAAYDAFQSLQAGA